jgi:drug/metabolite transporter (DMT)-like permease
MTIPSRASSKILATYAPFLALGLASLMWGTADVAGKLAMDGIPPVTLAALRFAVALIVLWPLARRTGLPRVPATVVAPLGLTGVALTFLLQNMGLARTEASNASLLQGAVPMFGVVFAVILLHEHLGLRRLVSVGIAALGVAAITLPGSNGIERPGLGDALVLASAGCFAIFIVMGRTAFPRYGTFPVLAGMATWGLAALIPAAAFELSRAQPTSVGLSEAGLVIYLGVGCSALTYALWGYALCHLEAASAAMFDALIPVVGVVAAMVVLRDAPTMWQLAGGTLVLSGVWMTLREPQRPAVQPGGALTAMAGD